MRNMLVVQLCTILLISGALGGMFVFTDVYNEVHSRIVSVLCLSCLKLQPKTDSAFTFTTANGEPHPSFVLENLTTGPIFLHYSADVCRACDIMMPIIQDYLNVNYSKQEFFTKTITMKNTNFTYIYMNIDHISKETRESLDIYDKANSSGVPMFTFITLGYDGGIIKPSYTSVYGEQPLTLIDGLTINMIEIYKQNQAGYIPHH
ncbi:MAG: hypothetical protein V1726_06660 [Methanobacteriota archaeon]